MRASGEASTRAQCLAMGTLAALSPSRPSGYAGGRARIHHKLITHITGVWSSPMSQQAYGLCGQAGEASTCAGAWSSPMSQQAFGLCGLAGEASTRAQT